MKVAHMVCSLCGRVNGQEHHDGCPNTLNRAYDYLEGWIAARDALLEPLARELEKMHSRFDGRFLLVPAILEGSARIVTFKIDLLTFDCSASSTVPWPDEVILDPQFGKAMQHA